MLSTSSANTDLKQILNQCMIIHAARLSHTKVALQTVDSDVLVVTISQMYRLRLTELWLDLELVKITMFLLSTLLLWTLLLITFLLCTFY